MDTFYYPSTEKIGMRAGLSTTMTSERSLNQRASNSKSRSGVPDLERMLADVEGLERLQQMQTRLLRELKKQLHELKQARK